jgi:ribokinase
VDTPVVVFVVGSINVDLVTFVPRLPAPGETVVGDRFEVHDGGKGANQAVAAARLGAVANLIGAVGNDREGKLAKDTLWRDGVFVGVVSIVRAPTGRASIIVDDAGQNLIAVAPGANHEVDGGLVRRAFRQFGLPFAVVLASLEVPLGAVTTAARISRERGWTFILNPAPARPLPRSLLALCDLVTPNETEAERLGGPDALLEAGAAAVIVTRGPDGADLYRPGEPSIHQPPFPTVAIDSTGAGDAFNGALAWALASRWPLQRAVEAGAAAGARASSRAGARTGMPTRNELETLLRTRS